jgi:hypothetical protein
LQLVLRIINVIALAAVLVLGAVPAHAHLLHHGSTDDGIFLEQLDDVHVHESGDIEPHEHDDPAVHCGAPLLGPQLWSSACALRVARIAYDTFDSSGFSGPIRDNLRPPQLRA